MVVATDCDIVPESADSVLDNRSQPKLMPSTMAYGSDPTLGGKTLTLEASIREMIAAYFGLQDTGSDVGCSNPQANPLGAQAERIAVRMHMYCRGINPEHELPPRATSAYFLYDWNSSKFMYWHPCSDAFAFDSTYLLPRTDCPGPQPHIPYR